MPKHGVVDFVPFWAVRNHNPRQYTVSRVGFRFIDQYPLAVVPLPDLLDR